MPLLHIIVLALLQGLTEFLPISSSAHLILVPEIAGWQDQGLDFDIAVHFGTLAAVVMYFRHELFAMSRDWFGSIINRRHTRDSTLAWLIILATIPVVIIGGLFHTAIETVLRSPLVIAVSTVVFGLLLWWADRFASLQRDEYTLTWRGALLIGIAQAVALIPGTSRSGITMTAGLMLGLSREGAARFSFLLSIPVIVAAAVLALKDLYEQSVAVDWLALVLGAVISWLAAYLCIHVFLRLIERIGMLPFVVYRLLLGALLFYLFV